MCACVTFKYIRVVKQSNSVSLENPNNLVGSGLQEETRNVSLACRTSSSPPKLKIFGGPAYYGYLCGSAPMKKTILDLLHSNESKRNIMYDDFGNQYGK